MTRQWFISTYFTWCVGIINREWAPLYADKHWRQSHSHYAVWTKFDTWFLISLRLMVLFRSRLPLNLYWVQRIRDYFFYLGSCVWWYLFLKFWKSADLTECSTYFISHTIIWLFVCIFIVVCMVGCHMGDTSWASHQIRKVAGCACAGNAGNVFPATDFQKKLLVSDPGMHHGTC